MLCVCPTGLQTLGRGSQHTTRSTAPRDAELNRSRQDNMAKHQILLVASQSCKTNSQIYREGNKILVTITVN